MANIIHRLAIEYLPPDASTFAKDNNYTFNFITWVCLFFFVLIVGLMLYYMFKYKRKSEDDVTPHISHNLVLEVIWSIVPIIIVIYMFYVGYKAFDRMMDPVAIFEEVGSDGKYIDLYVEGKQWYWDVTYPNGGVINSKASLAKMENGKDFSWRPLELNEDADPKKSNSKMYMTVPVGIPVRLNMTSGDVIHSFAVPAFRIKKDVIKNRSAVIWFKATKPGTYIYTCNEMCGLDHGHMIGYLRVVSVEEYEKFLESILVEGDPWDEGQKLYTNMCSACHSIDGTGLPTKLGPTWKDLWGKPGSEHAMGVGDKIEKVDEEYITESILSPNAKKPVGYENGVMPAQNLKPKQIKYLIEFMKSPNQKPEKE